ncbi:MAG: HAD-IIB family hydrolase [Burkholderiaceae bacterium]|nr:HAD-IIB family hydrolase [Burkholderiaceae bacterium]
MIRTTVPAQRAPREPRPLAELPAALAAGFHTVLTDIDDTLTTEGRLTAPAYAALDALHRAGLRVIPVTGRPAGWCDHIARMWPVDGVIGENGAFYMWHDAAAARLRVRHLFDAAQRQAFAERLAAVRERVLREVPGCALASDQFCRLYDLAIDFCEDVPALPDADVDRIVALMQAAGMTAKLSSIHINGWFGSWNKLDTARLMLAERHGIDLDAERERIVFAGDSPNDEPMFDFFPHAVGVANVLDQRHRLHALPTWITPLRAGAGFVELADALLAARG